MKYIKKIGIVGIVIASVLLSIKSSYADSVNIVEVKPTSTQTVDLHFDSIPAEIVGEIESDLRIYQDLEIKDIKADETDTKKVTLTLENTLKDENKYSLLSVAGAEGDMEFSYLSTQENGEFMNNSFEGLSQGIVKIVVQQNTITVYFYKDIIESDVDFKFYQNVSIDIVKTKSAAHQMQVVLTDSLVNESTYVATTTFFAGDDNAKVEIENGIYDFSTVILEEFDESMLSINDEQPESETSAKTEENQSDELTLQSALLDALDESGIGEEGAEMLDNALENASGDELIEEGAEILNSALENIDGEEVIEKGSDILENVLESVSGSEALEKGSDLLDGVLTDSKEELLESELELMAELNAAADDDNNQPTQLETVAMSTKETPDTGAETWVILLGTFIINTFYYLSRRRKLKTA